MWLGFGGSLLILIGSLSPAYLPQASPMWDVLRSWGIDGPTTKWVGTGTTLIGLGALLESWFRLRPAARRARGRQELRTWPVLGIIAAPLLFGPPIFSHDAYSYAAHGWLMENHLSPYQVGPGTLPGYFADQVAWVWRETTAPYGPLALWQSHVLDGLVNFDPFLSAIAMRVPALFGVALIGLCVPRIARRVGVDPAAASWFAVLNPILVIDFIGGAHNDSQMTGLMLLGILITMRYRTWWWGALVVGVAAAVKQPAFLVAVALPFLVTPWTSWKLKPTAIAAAKALASLGLSAAVFAGISVASGLGFGWINAINVPGMVDTVSPFTVVGHIIQFPVNLVTGDPDGRAVVATFKGIGAVVGALGIMWYAIRHLGKRPLHFVSYSFIWFALCAPAIHSWYLLWGAVLLPMTKPSTRALRAAIMFTVFLLGFNAMNFGLRNGMWLMVFVLFGVSYWIVHAHELSQPIEQPDAARSELGSAVAGGVDQERELDPVGDGELLEDPGEVGLHRRE